MTKFLLTMVGAALVAAASPALAQPPPAPDAGNLDKLVKSCRVYVEIAYRNNDARGFNAYVDRLLRDPRRNRDEIVACGAYMLGAMDMNEGRVVPPAVAKR